MGGQANRPGDAARRRQARQRLPGLLGMQAEQRSHIREAGIVNHAEVFPQDGVDGLLPAQLPRCLYGCRVLPLKQIPNN